MISKSAADYTSVAEHMNERCRLCQHFVDPKGCEIVKGLISPRGWCKYFERSEHATSRD
jgi:hypothetical protein